MSLLISLQHAMIKYEGIYSLRKNILPYDHLFLVVRRHSNIRLLRDSIGA